MNPFRVYITDDYSGKTFFVITKTEGNKMYAAKQVEMVFEEVPEGTFFKEPTLSFPWHQSKDFIAALKEGLEGQKLPEGRVEGELKATKAHLEDMRRLVFEEQQLVNVLAK